VDRLVREDKIDWLKLDYNQDVGEAFDPPGPERSGTVLYDHLRYYLDWLAQIRKDYPNLILENCSSGGVRLDLAMLSQTHTTWMSDITTPRASVELAYGCTLEFPPEVCNHWTVGDEDKGDANERGHINLSAPPGWWDFLFRVQMNGQFGISSLVATWTPELKKRAIESVELYKRLRTVIAGSDVYHLTPPPASGEHPTGWMALQYVAPDRKRSVVMAYRLAESKPRQTLRLRGLDPEWDYTLQDGPVVSARNGRHLASEGLDVKLDAEWRSAVIELRKVER
jgi:alpha-galactosidase